MERENSAEDRERLFGPITNLVKIEIEGKTYEVPEGLELLRCYQYLDFEIAAENFCWNGNCEHCATLVAEKGKPEERVLCCQTPAREGMSVSKLPVGVTPRAS